LVKESLAAVVAAALQHRLPDFMAGNDSALMLAAPDQPPVMRDVWLVSHPDMKGSAVVRAVVNAVREDFGLMP
jgi:DNA-binding transcriptional LysR family regulator